MPLESIIENNSMCIRSRIKKCQITNKMGNIDNMGTCVIVQVLIEISSYSQKYDT